MQFLSLSEQLTRISQCLFYISSRLAQASVQALYNISSSPVVLGPGQNLNILDSEVVMGGLLFRRFLITLC